jgi:hypothetical protein
MLQNPRHEKFAQLLASGMSAKDAYSGAGYRASDSNGAWLARKEEIRTRVAEISALAGVSAVAACKRLALTRDSLTEMAHEVYVKAMEAGQYSPAIGAVREMGILTGLRIERSERGQPGEFDNVSTEQLLAELRELGYTVN